MGRMFTEWSRWHRLSRVLFLIVALVGVLIWVQFNKPPPKVSDGVEWGKVISVNGSTVAIALADGKKTILPEPTPRPKRGDEIRMLVETYQDGSKRYAIDLVSWKLDHSR